MEAIKSDFTSKGIRCDGSNIALWESSFAGQDKTWKNKMASRAFVKMSFYNPINSAKKVKAPVLLVSDCNHFALYTGAIFEKHIDKQVAFLIKNLMENA